MLKNAFHKFVSDDPKSWNKMIDLLMLIACREIPCVTTGFFLFALIYCRAARSPLQILKEDLRAVCLSGDVHFR